MSPVFTFSHFGKTYRIVRTRDFPWRSHFGFLPRQPYLLVDEAGCSSQGVTEVDLAWYRSRYATAMVSETRR